MDSVTAKRQDLEKLYLLFAGDVSHYKGFDKEPTERGRQQFYNYESHGKYPDEPDPFFMTLQHGKKSFHILQTTLKESYGTFEWYGLYCYWLDWKGERWVLKYLFSWMNQERIPDWFYREDIEDPPL